MINIFGPDYKLHTITQAGLRRGYIRVEDTSTGWIHDLLVDDKRILPQLNQWFNGSDKEHLGGNYDIKVIGRTDNLIRIETDKDGNLPEVGSTTGKDVVCHINIQGISELPQIISSTALFNNADSRNAIPLVFDTRPQASLSPDYDSEDKNASNARAVEVAGSFGGSMCGFANGTYGNFVSNGGSQTNDAENVTTSTQEVAPAGGLLTSHPLDRFFIPLAGAVSLPMPHIPNLAKMIGIGVFIKNVVGKKGSHVKEPDGTRKWKNGTGIYGLADEVADIGRTIELPGIRLPQDPGVQP